jgi:putative transposase
MVSPSSRRRAVKHIVGKSLGSASQACRAIGIARSSYYRKESTNQGRQVTEKRIIELSQSKPRYGYRFITALMRAEGLGVNRKRVQRIRAREGLQVRKKQRSSRRLGISSGQRRRAEAANQVWSWDIIHDQLENGVALRILTLMDEFTKQSMAIKVGHSIRATDAIGVIQRAIEEYGLPQHIRSDNGSEFIAGTIRDWMSQKQIKTIYIKPGSPWEQPFIESFHDKFRDECLNREIFATLAEARVIIEMWRSEYNQRRPHSSLGYLSPDRFAAAQDIVTSNRERSKDKRWAGDKLGSKERLTHKRPYPDRHAAATSRTCPRHSRSAPVRGAYG